MDARMRRNSRHDLAQPLERLAEGDFLRLRVAHIFLAPFAALAPRAAYAAPYVDGQFLRRQAGDVRPEVGPDVAAYLAQLGEDPELPFVVPILDMKGKPLMTFIVPARYSGLLDNARLLAGNLTVVGKVIYIERRFPGDPNCNNLTRFGCTYVDHTTAQTFAPALQKASPAVRRLLGLGDQSPAEFVRESVTFTGPLVVLLPVAIFQ
jgi:hypothetical protein